MKRYIAAFLSASLVISGTPAFAAPALPQTAAQASVSVPANPSELRIPKELGSVKEVFRGQDDQTVIILQDAHAIPDAQRKIQRLIDYLTRQYSIPLVALEGAASPLDPFLLRTFPDREVLEKVLGGYFDRGELAGGTAAAIFPEAGSSKPEAGQSDLPTSNFRHPTQFVGIEDWELYQEGLGHFLAAMEKDKEINALLRKEGDILRVEKEKSYSPELLAADRAIRSFHAEDSDLVALLKKLEDFQPPPKDSGLALLLAESKDPGKEDGGFDAEIKKIEANVEKVLKGLPHKEAAADLRALHKQSQDYRTSRAGLESFAFFLKETVIKYRIKIRVSKGLSRLAGRQKRLRDIEGTQLFEDLGAYEQSVKKSLFKSGEERRLDGESRRLDLMEKLRMLELNTKEWGELEKQIRDAGSKRQEGKKPSDEPWSMDNGLWTAFAPHLAFYRNAESREAALFSNLKTLLNRNGKARTDQVSSAVVVAGGFHAEGFKSLFEAAGISYVLVMPKIDSIPEETNYRKHMRGDVSWSQYFEVKDGKVNLYDAFVRGVREQLLKATDAGYKMLDRNEKNNKADHESGILNPGSAQMLKRWRDDILRGLAGEGRIAESSQYTRFIDEVINSRGQSPAGTVPDMTQQWRDNVDRFLRGLRDLKAKNQMNEHNIAKLLQPNLMADPGATAPLAKGELRADLLGLSSVRDPGFRNYPAGTETRAVEKLARRAEEKNVEFLPNKAGAVSGAVSDQIGPAENAAPFARRELRADPKIDAVAEFYRPAESPEDIRGQSLISDVHGDHLGWVLFYDSKKDAFLKEMILKLEPNTTAIFFVRDAILKKEIQDWLSKNKPRQKAIFYVANVHLSSWARDRLLFVRTKEGLKIVLPKIPESFAQTLRLNTLQAVRHFAQSAGIPVTESELIFEGGNILFDGDTILVGRNMIEDNGRIQKWDRAKIRSELIKILGPDRPVLEVDDPLNYHLDMSLTLLPGKTVILGDPALGLTALLNDDPNRVGKFYEEENRRKKENGYEFEASLRRTKSLTKKFQPGTERLAASLEAQGFTVRRIPLVLGYASDARTYPAISYNNVIFEGRRVFLPQFGLSSDQKARKVFEELGYEVVPLDQAVISMTDLGCVRCASQKVSAETPKVFETWAAALKALETVSTPEATGLWVWVHAGEAASSWLQGGVMTTPTKVLDWLRLMYSWRDRKLPLASKIGQAGDFLRQRFGAILYSDHRWKAVADTWAGLLNIFFAGPRRNFNAALEDALVIFSKSEAAFDLFLSFLSRPEAADLLRYYIESPPSLTQLAQVCDILSPYSRHIRVMEEFYNDPSLTSEEMHVFLGRILERLSPAGSSPERQVPGTVAVTDQRGQSSSPERQVPGTVAVTDQRGQARAEMRTEEPVGEKAARFALPDQTVDKLLALKRAAQALLGQAGDRGRLEKLYWEGLDGIELGEGIRLEKYGLGFLMKKQDKTVALGQLLFIPREGGTAVEVGRESFEPGRGYGSRFIEVIRRAMPEEVMMVQTVTNRETLEALADRLPEKERRQVEVVREAWIRKQKDEALKSVPSVVMESVKRAWMRALAEVYSKNGDLIPDAEFLRTTVLGKGAAIYGDDIRLVVNGKSLELRTKARSPERQVPGEVAVADQQGQARFELPLSPSDSRTDRKLGSSPRFELPLSPSDSRTDRKLGSSPRFELRGERGGPKKKTWYEYLGVNQWKRVVESQLAKFPYFSNMKGLRGQVLLDTVEAFIGFTRQKERYHLATVGVWVLLWGGIFYLLPSMLGVASLPWFVKAAMGIHGIFLVITDVYPVLLQRKNRIRAERIMGKLIERKKAWTADPTRIRAAVDEALKSDTRFGQNIQYERYGDRPLASGYQAYRIVSADERSYGESREDFLKRQFDALVAGGRLVLVAENAEELLGFKDLLYEIAASPGGYLDSFRVLEDPKRLETDWGETYFAVLEKKAISWFPQDEIPDSESPVKKMGLKEIPQTLSGRMPDTKPVEELFERVLSPATRPALERFMDRIWFAISHGRIPADEQEFWFKRFFENLLPSDEREFKNYLEEVNSFFDEIIALFGTEGQEGRQLPAVLSEAEWLLIKVSRNRIYPADDESAMTQAAVFIRQFRALWRRSAAFAEGADRARMLRETLPVLIRLAVQLQAVPKRGKSLSDDYNWMGLQSLLSAPEIRFDGIVYRRANVYAPYGDGDHAFAEGKNPIFQMELVNPENGERLYLLAKLLDRGSDHDVIYQTSAKLLGLPSYRVETYREPFAVPWQLIEYVPAGPIAATVQKQIPGLVMLKEPLLEFDASRVESFLAKDQEDAAGRLRELGGHLALEDLLGARDSTMKHFLLAREGVPRIVKIDTEYLLDYGERSGTNIPRPLEPSSDVMKFVKMLEEHPKKTVWLKALEDGFNRVKENARAQIGVIEEIIRSRDVPYPPEKSEALRGRASRTFEELRRSYSDAPPRAEMRGDLPAAALELANALNEYAKGVPGIAPHIPLHELLGQMSGGQLHGLLGGLLADIPELTDSDQPDGLMKAVYQSVKEINRALKADTNVMIVFFKAESGAEVMGKKVPETPHFAVVDRREIERHIRELGMSSQGRAERVLVAEDDDKLTKTYQRWADFIKTTGLAEFDVVEDGKKGLEKLRESERAQKRTDLILSDVDMPGMDGIEMVESYRKESKGPAVPVVWVTGRNMREMGDAKDWDRTTYVGKPSLWHQTLLDGHFALLTGILMGLDEGGSGVSGIRSESRISGDDLLREKGDKIQSLVRFGIAAVLRPGMDVLEMGIGSGVLTDELTDMADSRGVRFTGIDLNPEAVRMSKMLFEEKKKEVRVLEGDLFSPLEADEQFDVVSWNPPWYFDGGGKSLAKDDPGFRTLKRFLEQAPRFLKPGGKLFLIMPEESMAAVWDEAESFFDIESKAAETTKRRTVRIYELTPRAELPAGFTQVSETAGVVVDALRPDVNTNLDRSELRQVYEFARSDFDGLVGEITKLAGAKIEARRAELREEGRVAPNLSQSWVEQSQALFDWWKRGIESQKPPIAVPREQERGAMTLAIRLGNAEEHDSFLAQLLKVLGAQERKTTLFSDKTSQRYVAKAIGAHGLKSVISSVPMGARDIKTGVSELHRKDQPDVPIGLLDGTDAVEELSDTFVGVALEEGETPPDPDVIFHNELLFAIILCLMPEMIGTEAYREEVRAKTERLPVEEKGRSDKIKEIKAETLKAALLKQLEQLGYTAEIFSSQSAQFLTLNGAQIARMITEIRARAEIRKAA